MNLKLLLAAAATTSCALCAMPAYAGPSNDPFPISASLWDPIQAVKRGRAIHGFRLNIYGRNQNMYGYDLGLANRVDGDLIGVQSGLLNWVEGEAIGARMGVVNFSKGSTIGYEGGIVNYTPKVKGLQLGVVNVTDELRGLQIGLVNFAKNGFLPVFVIVNAAFK